MIPHIVKGGDMRGLVGYLVSTRSPTDPRANQHEHPHIVGGDTFMTVVYSGQELTAADGRAVADYLDEPRRAYDVAVQKRAWTQDQETGERVAVLDPAGRPAWRDQHVWHCSLSLADGETLTGEQWAEVTREFADGMGLTEASGHAPARWVAIHHGAGKGGHDHVHIAASAVREDGTRVSFFRDFPRAQAVCREIEQRRGLVVVGGREHGTATRGYTPVEAATGRTDDRQTLGHRIRAAAVASTSEAEWVRRVRAGGVVVKPRFAAGTSDVVTGYRAALKPARRDDPIRFYSGGHIGADLTLPRLREGWAEPTLEQADEASAEWQAAHAGRPPVVRDGREAQRVTFGQPEAARRSLHGYADRVAGASAGSRDLWALVAHDVAGTLAAWSTSDPERADALCSAAAVLARTAQMRRAGAPPGSARRRGAGAAAAVFTAARMADRPGISAAAMMAQLVRTAEAVAAFHRSAGQHREASAIGREVERLAGLQWPGYHVSGGPERAREATVTRTANRERDGR